MKLRNASSAPSKAGPAGSARPVAPAGSATKLLSEFAQLGRLRKETGISPLQYHRWLDLRRQLADAFPGRPPPAGGRVRLLVEYDDRRALRQSIMATQEPIGIFVPTPFAAETGTEFDLRVKLLDTNAVFESPVVVISNNVGPDLSTRELGMGVRFATADSALRREVNELYG